MAIADQRIPHAAHCLSRHDYERLVQAGVFAEGQRVELIGGEILDVSPQNSPHVTAVHLLGDLLRRCFGSGFMVRVQAPLALSDDSEPEPDLAVVAGSPRDYASAHPRTALLVVEVADTSLGYDREVKVPLYGRAGIPEYWLLDLVHRRLEVHRQPGAEGYDSRRVLGEGERIAPVAAADEEISVAEILP